MAEEVLVSLSLRFPTLDRRALAEHLGPVVVEAIAAGGLVSSLTIQPFDPDDLEDE